MVNLKQGYNRTTILIGRIEHENHRSWKRLTDLGNELMVTREKGWRRGMGVWDGHVHTAMFKIDNQQGPTV